MVDIIKEYIKKDGSKAYMFKTYLGIDPFTNKQKHTTRRGFKTKREAKIALAKLQTSTSENGFLNNEATTFLDVYNLWLEGYKNTVKESSLVKVVHVFDTHILPQFSHLVVKKITTAYCQKVVNEWHKISSTSIYANYTNTILKYAVKLGVITHNPFNAVQKPKKIAKMIDDEDLYYSKDELQTFLACIEDDLMLYSLFRLLAFTGMRKGELLALTWNDIDFINKTVTINKTLATGLNNKLLIQTPKTKSSIRTISLDDKTLQTLRQWKAYQLKNWLKLGFNTNSTAQALFTNTKNEHLQLTNVNKILDAITSKHNLKKIKVHGFRHTHCSLLFESGATIQEVQNRLGHGNIKTTMDIYAHVTKKQQENMAKNFQKYINF